MLAPGPGKRVAYQDDFTDPRLFNNAWSTDNATVDLNYGGLTTADTTRPGQVVYAFAAPQGVKVQDMSVKAVATICRRNLPGSDGYLEVLAEQARKPKAARPAGRFRLPP